MPTADLQTCHRWNWPAFAVLTIVQIWLAHAIGYLAHEYAHSTTAWLMGWKANPLALHYGHLDAENLLTLSDIDENVDYAPIFVHGADRQAGVIAAAGVVIGNGLITYPASLFGYARSQQLGARGWAMFWYWLCVMSVGNFICYVPARTFSYREDMHTAEQGFHCSPWLILLVLGVPFAAALIHFLVSLEPRWIRWIASDSTSRRIAMAVLTASLIFCFFGLAGLSKSGSTSHEMSLISGYVLFPITAIAGAAVVARKRSRSIE